MKRSLVLLGLTLLISASMQAKHITSSEALQLAFHKTSCRAAKAMSAARYMLAYSADGFYAYNKSKSDGFIILAADDCVPDMILGYADCGTFDYVAMPDAMKEWLNQMNGEVANLAAIEARYPNRVASSLDTLETIEPLVQSQWDQGSPYNLMTPQLSDGSQSAAGCVAVAMAQIMGKHKWPESYDWNNICNTYNNKNTDAQNNAIAKLMLDCGVSVNSSYTSGGTTANIADVGPAFVNDFDYDKSLLHVRRYFYSKREWRDLLYNNLAQGMPIYYRGTSIDGGHAFVCDGYKDGLFHINWGWSGMSDGYFQIALLDPAEQGIGGSTGGYHMNQEAILGIKPNAGGDMQCLMYCDDNFTTSTIESSTTGKANFWGRFENDAYTSVIVNLGVKLVDESGNVQYVASPNQKGCNILSGNIKSSMSISFSDVTLTAGTYTITPAYQVSGSDIWQDMRVNQTVVHQCILAIVDENGIITFSRPTTDKSLTVTSIAPRTRILAGYNTDVNYTVKCPEGDYLGYVTIAFVESGTNTLVCQSSKGIVDLAEGEEFSYSADITNPTTAGSYDLVLIDTEGNIISDRYPVSVEEAPTGELAYKGVLSLKNSAMDNLTFKLNLQCNSGVFNNKITVFVYDKANNKVGSIPCSTKTFLVEGDDPIDITFKGALELTAGAWYTAYAYFPNPSWTLIAQRTFKPTAATGSGIQDIQFDATDNAGTYNLIGQKVNADIKGIIIRGGRKYMNR